MEQLLSLLKTIPEYAAMVSSLQDGESVAVTGIGQINRSHMIAGLCRSLNRPMVVLCQDDLAARLDCYEAGGAFRRKPLFDNSI